jgi:hypothetical protein
MSEASPDAVKGDEAAIICAIVPVALNEPVRPVSTHPDGSATAI